MKKALEYVEKGITFVVPIIGIVAALDLPMYLARVSLFPQQYLGLFWGLISAFIFLTLPASKKHMRDKPPWYDLILAGLSICVGIYITIWYPKVLLTLGLIETGKIILGIMAVIIVLETTRRVSGWPLVVIVGGFILYARFAHLFPGPLGGKSVSWERLITQLYLGVEFLFGTPLRIAVLVVFGFVLFGQFLFSTGGGDFFIKIAQGTMGKRRGGPAKVAVIASSLFGTISGSAVANVVSTGAITIPLMKKTGYPSVFAGAVEAVSSTGGCIMPPVMGAVAFIMAEFLGIPYSTVAIAAFVPALLYYLGDFMQIDLRAAKLGLKGLSEQEIPSVKKTLQEGWPFLIPVGVLVYALFVLDLRPGFSALIATASLLFIGVVKKDIRSKLKFTHILTIFRGVTKGMLEITAVCAAAGFIVGIVTYTGLGFSLSAALVKVSGESLLSLAILTAIASTILGMGMPVTACYLLLATLTAPAMVKLGVDPLRAHLFVLYYGTFSFLTPPVCLAVYAASTLAEAPAMATGIQAMKLAFAGYLVPFIFLYKPGLILQGTLTEIALALFEGVMAVILLAYAIEGYLFRSLGLMERIAFGVASVLLFWPGLKTTLVGLMIGGVALFLHWQTEKARGRKNKP
jgi:TRAP transporter 4TM/12TM fusion protein